MALLHLLIAMARRWRRQAPRPAVRNDRAEQRAMIHYLMFVAGVGEPRIWF